MTAASDAIAAIFADDNMASDASWRIDAGGDPIPCRVILRAPDGAGSFGGASIVADLPRLEVQVAQVAKPGRGDKVTVAGELFEVLGEPTRDKLRLIWTCEARAR